MFTCFGTHIQPTPHQHDASIQARVCYGLAPAPGSVTIVHPSPSLAAHGATAKQISYISNLGGSVEAARRMTWKEASRYIDDLKLNGARPMAGSVTDPRLAMVAPLLDLIPDGYFAAALEEGSPITFLRISSPKSGHFKDTRKVQTQHGPRLENALALWPSGTWSEYKSSAIEPLMWVVADYKTAALRYAREIGHCCRCNAELTDDHSRHYGIGPECVKYWPWVIEYVDDHNALSAS